MDADDDAAAVLSEVRGRVLLITLNRPEAMNAINGAISHGLVAAITRLDADDALSAGVLTGAGRGFCAGMDLKAFARGDDIGPVMAFFKNGAHKPLIGAVEGFALAGGLELALSCDLLVASAGARFGIPEVTVGLFAAGGGLLKLPSRVGHGRAMEMALTGDPITAEQALELGLVVRVAERGATVAAALELAERIARNAPLALTASKQLINQSVAGDEQSFWERQRMLYPAVFMSQDAKEGPRAFAERRSPSWTGR